MSKRIALAMVCAALALTSCGEEKVEMGAGGDTPGGGDAGGDGGDGTGADGSDGTGADGSTPGTSPFPTDPNTGLVLCGTAPCKCNDGVDNDEDGLVDGADPECTGPYDDDEGTFATGIPGDNKDFCQDCFFDGNSGQGDDGCAYHTQCLYTGQPPSNGGGSACFNCDVSEQCLDFCSPRTPNGCDCFGCCEVRTESGETVNIFLAETCSLDKVGDETACPRCVPTDDCKNECGRCELCLGKTEADLPADCVAEPEPDSGTPPPSYTCDRGEQVCGESMPCPTGSYCQQGCCLTTVI